MGVKCQIIRDSEGEILNVEAPNGNNSLLYKDLLSLSGSKDRALALWAFSYTEEFQNTEKNDTDANGEYLADNVIKFVESSEIPLSATDIASIETSLLNIPVRSLQSLYNTLTKAFYTNNIFSVSKKALEDSKLYTKREIETITRSPKIRTQVHSTIKKIEGHLKMYGDVSLERKEISNPLLFKTDTLSPIGKYENVDLTEELTPYLAGITDVYEFEQAIKMLPFPSVIKAAEQGTFSTMLYNKYSQIMPVEKYFVKDGEMVQQTNEIPFKTILKTGTKVPLISVETDALVQLPLKLESIVQKELKTLLKTIADKSIEAGIDLFPLTEQYSKRPTQQIVDFVAKTDAFIALLHYNAADLKDVENFAVIYNEFFELTPKPIVAYTNKSDFSITNITTSLDEIEMFEKFGMIKVGTNEYQKVNTEEDIEEIAVAMAIENHEVFPQAAYFPVAYNANDEFVPTKVNEDNARQIKLSIRNFVSIQASKHFATMKTKTAEQIVLFKILFGHKFFSETVDTQQAFINYLEFNGDPTYLTGEFISDFYIAQTKEKYKNSPLYNEVLRHFTVFEGGIQGQAPINVPNTPLMQNLKDYSVMSKTMPTINTPMERNISPTEPFLRMLYLNTPEILPNYKGTFRSTDDGIIVPNSSKSFIRIGQQVYERKNVIDGSTFYKEIVALTSPDYNVIEPINSSDMDLTTTVNSAVATAKTLVKNDKTLENEYVC